MMNDEFSKPCYTEPRSPKPRASKLFQNSAMFSLKAFQSFAFYKEQRVEEREYEKQNNLTKMVKFHILKYCPKREEN